MSNMKLADLANSPKNLQKIFGDLHRCVCVCVCACARACVCMCVRMLMLWWQDRKLCSWMTSLASIYWWKVRLCVRKQRNTKPSEHYCCWSGSFRSHRWAYPPKHFCYYLLFITMKLASSVLMFSHKIIVTCVRHLKEKNWQEINLVDFHNCQTAKINFIPKFIATHIPSLAQEHWSYNHTMEMNCNTLCQI